MRAMFPLRRGRRLLAQLLLLPLVYALSLPDPLLYTNIIFLIAFVTVPVNGTVAAILVWSSRQAPEIETLRERADDSVTLFLMSVATASTAVVAILQRIGFEFPGRPTLAILSWLAILIVVPALGWLGTWRDRWLPAVRTRLAEKRRQLLDEQDEQARVDRAAEAGQDG